MLPFRNGQPLTYFCPLTLSLEPFPPRACLTQALPTHPPALSRPLTRSHSAHTTPVRSWIPSQSAPPLVQPAYLLVITPTNTLTTRHPPCNPSPHYSLLSLPLHANYQLLFHIICVPTTTLSLRTAIAVSIFSRHCTRRSCNPTTAAGIEPVSLPCPVTLCWFS